MLSFFKKKKNKKPLQNWQIPVDTNYQIINNNDSIQFIDAGKGIALYFSILTVSNNSLLPVDVLSKMRPSVTRLENGWQLKGTKSGGKEVLVCLFSFTNDSDQVLMEHLFTNIVYAGE